MLPVSRGPCWPVPDDLPITRPPPSVRRPLHAHRQGRCGGPSAAVRALLPMRLPLLLRGGRAASRPGVPDAVCSGGGQGQVRDEVNVDRLSTCCPRLQAGLSVVPVDCAWQVSALVGTIVGKDTTSESTPEQRCANTARGPRRPKGHDRLMDKVQPPSDSAPAAVCPTCGGPPTASSHRHSGGVNIGDYRCRAGHIWSTHWPAVA
jgi:hypothetical protein